MGIEWAISRVWPTLFKPRLVQGPLAWPLLQLPGGTASCLLERGFLRQEGCGIPAASPALRAKAGPQRSGG